jgi:hypothetical protein
MRPDMQERLSMRFAGTLAVFARVRALAWAACVLVAGPVACGSSSGSGSPDSGPSDGASQEEPGSGSEDASANRDAGGGGEAGTGGGEAGTGGGEAGTGGGEAGTGDGEAGTGGGGSCSAFLGTCGASGGTCCSGMICAGNDHYCCVYDGFLSYGSCSFDDNCCSGHCEHSDSGAIYGICCYIEGQTCQYPTDCCPGLSCGAQGVCE